MKFDLTLARESLPEIIANKLEELIIEEKFVAEQKLPSEQALADQFGVSRPVIREAMKILKARGLIIQKNGEGTFIHEPDSGLITDTVNRIIHLKNIDVEDIYEVRINLELLAVAQAVIKADDKGFEELQEINDELERYKDNIEKRVQGDVQFHKKIAQLSGNLLLEMFVESMAVLITQITKYTLERKVGNEEGIYGHQGIIDALRSRNVAEAKKMVRMHLEKSQQNYLSALTQREEN